MGDGCGQMNSKALFLMEIFFISVLEKPVVRAHRALLLLIFAREFSRDLFSWTDRYPNLIGSVKEAGIGTLVRSV